MANQLRLDNVNVSAGGVRGVWLRHDIETRHKRLLRLDWGTLKGLGKVYVQVLVDVSCSFAFAKVYTSKMPITACDLLNDRVLPFYEHVGIALRAVLTDNAREFCGKPESHPYELMLAVEGIQHRTTKVRSPAHQRLRRAHKAHASRRGLPCSGPHQMVQGARRDSGRPRCLYGGLQLQRTHQGYRVAGRTPVKALFDLLARQRALPPISEPEEDIRLAT